MAKRRHAAEAQIAAVRGTSPSAGGQGGVQATAPAGAAPAEGTAGGRHATLADLRAEAMRAAAYHEAGHVVGRVLGMTCAYVTIAGDGHGQSAFVASAPVRTWSALRSQILVLMAGAEAERECCPLSWGGDLDDLVAIGRLLDEAELLQLEPRLRSATRKLLVGRHRQKIERVAAALLEHGTLAGAAIERAIGGVVRATRPWDTLEF